MLSNFWNKVVEWFTDNQERNRLLRGFNNSARASFVAGEAPTLLRASLSRGNSNYRHQFSHWLYSLPLIPYNPNSLGALISPHGCGSTIVTIPSYETHIVTAYVLVCCAFLCTSLGSGASCETFFVSRNEVFCYDAIT